MTMLERSGSAMARRLRMATIRLTASYLTMYAARTARKPAAKQRMIRSIDSMLMMGTMDCSPLG